LRGGELATAEQHGVKRVVTSLTHTAETAFAIVILENGN